MDFELAIVEAGKQAYEWKFIATVPLSTDDDEFSWPTAKANARLIAAAPELLAALRAIDESQLSMSATLEKQMHAALAAAEKP